MVSDECCKDCCKDSDDCCKEILWAIFLSILVGILWSIVLLGIMLIAPFIVGKTLQEYLRQEGYDLSERVMLELLLIASGAALVICGRALRSQQPLSSETTGDNVLRCELTQGDVSCALMVAGVGLMAFGVTTMAVGLWYNGVGFDSKTPSPPAGPAPAPPPSRPSESFYRAGSHGPIVATLALHMENSMAHNKIPLIIVGGALFSLLGLRGFWCYKRSHAEDAEDNGKRNE